MQQPEAHPLFAQLAEYASQIQNQHRTIESTLALTERTKNERGDAFTLVLANPTPTAEGVVRWTAVAPSCAQFYEAITDRISRGYLPLGVLDVNTATGIVFSDMVPESVRNDYIDFASVQTRIVYKTLTGKMGPQDSWLEDSVLFVRSTTEEKKTE